MKEKKEEKIEEKEKKNNQKKPKDQKEKKVEKKSEKKVEKKTEKKVEKKTEKKAEKKTEKKPEKKSEKRAEKKEEKKAEKKENVEKDSKTKSEKKEESTGFKQMKKNKPLQFKEKEEKQEKKIKTKTIEIATIVLIAIILIFSTIFALINMGNSKILKGITIKEIDVSGLTKEEAVEKLTKIYDEKKSKEIELKYQDYETTIDLNVLETNYEIEKAVNEAVEIGKQGNIFVNNFEIIKTFLLKKDIDVESTINDQIADQTVEDIGTKLPGIVVESSYYVEDEQDSLIIGKGKKGIVIDRENLINKIKEEINKTEVTQEYIEIPVIEKDPDPIDIEKIHTEIYTEVQDAYYTKDPFEVHPEVEGIDFDVEAAKAALAEEKEEYVIPLIITKPKVTLSDIGTEAFPDKLSTFTTKYDATNTDRTTNLRLACQKINGKVILPGETFSYNKTLGKRTAEAGYRNGKVYENGEVVDGIGGGICQISSTLYNTALLANMEIVERRNHQFVTSYLPAGRDATVVYGSTDFKFKNTRKYPVRIVASINSGIATVTMFGIKEEEEYTISFSTKTISTIPPTTKYQEDPTLPAGTEKVKQAGSNGLVTETYITKKLNGKVVETKLLSRDTYNAMQKIILRGGTGTAPQQTEPQQTTPQEAEQAAPASTAPQTNTGETKPEGTKPE